MLAATWPGIGYVALARTLPAPAGASSGQSLVPQRNPEAPLRLASDLKTPAAGTEALLAALADHGVNAYVAGERPDLMLQASCGPCRRLAYERILVPAARFSTLVEDISLDQLRGLWSGTAASPDFSTIYVPQDTLPDLEALLGTSGPAVKTVAADALADAVWADDRGMAVVPFEALTPQLHALHLDGLSAVDNRLERGRWPLATRAWLAGTTEYGRRALGALGAKPLVTNRDPGKLTVLAMTGVTALTRGTAAAIEKAGDDAFPARIVGPELAAADITTTSNEVSFLDGCPVDNRAGVATFCSSPKYYATLELSGIDLTGLTGNHLNDYGTAAFTTTLALYVSKGMRVYGGGLNQQAASAPLIVEDHGNRLAFLGANQFGPVALTSHDGESVSAWAGANTPGSARYSQADMVAEIAALRPEVDLVFAELQYTEFNAQGDYQTEPVPGQAADFRALLDAGAEVVTGVQAHAPQAVELRGNGLILYGLGNLYFDQTWSWPTRTGLIARHTIYQGRLLSTELLVIVLDWNMQPRWATPQERVDVLRSVYAASGW